MCQITLVTRYNVDIMSLTVSNRQQTDEFELILELVECDDAGGEEADCVEAVHEDPGHAVPPPPDNIIHYRSCISRPPPGNIAITIHQTQWIID